MIPFRLGPLRLGKLSAQISPRLAEIFVTAPDKAPSERKINFMEETKCSYGSVSALLCVAVAAVATTFSASAVDLSKLPPPSSRHDVTFEKDIKPLFEASCVRCHGGEKPKAGLRLETREGALKGGKEGEVIEVGKSADSALVVAIAQLDPETAMPPKPRRRRNRPEPQAEHGTNAPAGGPAQEHRPPPKPLTAEEVGLVRAWIDQGAK